MNQMTRFGAALLGASLLCIGLSGCGTVAQMLPSQPTEEVVVTTQVEEVVEPEVVPEVVPEVEEDVQLAEPEILFDLDNVTDISLLLAGIPGDTVVGTANGAEITAIDYLYAASYVCGQMSSTYAYYYGTTQLPWDEAYTESQSWRTYMTQSALMTAGLYAVIPAIVAEQGVTLSQEALDLVEAEIAATKAEMPEGMNTDYIFWQAATTEEAYRTLSQTMYGYDALVEHYIETGIDGYPSTQEMEAYWETQSNYAVKHILFQTIDDSYASLSDAAILTQRMRANNVLDELRASDDPVALFDSLMNEHSEDLRDESGALLSPDGYVTYSGQMVSEFETASLALADYEISDLVETNYGYHIIMRLPLEVDYDACRETLVAEAVYQMQSDWMTLYPVVTNEAFETIDIQLFYENLQALCTQMNWEIAQIS